MPDIIITPNSGTIDFIPVSSVANRIQASGGTFNLINTTINSGTILNIEGTNGSLFSVVDSLTGSLMSVNNSAGLPVFEVFSDDSIIGGRFNNNDWVVSSSGNVGIGTAAPLSKLHVVGDITSSGFIASSGSAALPSYDFVNDPDTGIFSPSANTVAISASGLEQLRVVRGGVGIGMTPIANSSNILSVNGRSTFTSFIGVNQSNVPDYPLEVNGSIVVHGSAINSVLVINPNDYSLEIIDSNPHRIVRFDSTASVFSDINGSDGLYYSRTNNRVGILTASPATPLDVDGHIRSRKLYLESLSSPSITASSGLTLDLNTSQLFNVSLNRNITTLTISNTPSTSNTAVGFSLIFTADGTARSVTWPSGFKWAGGSAPTLTSASGKIDVLSFVTTNSGTNWLGFVGGQNY